MFFMIKNKRGYKIGAISADNEVRALESAKRRYTEAYSVYPLGVQPVKFTVPTKMLGTKYFKN